jgi:hypothetical protein
MNTNRSGQNWYRQFRLLIPTILIAYSLTLAVVVGISLYAISTGRRVWYFTVDPFIIGNLPFYAGILSNIGILLWSASATVCFFSVTILRNEELLKRYKWFLIMSGLMTSLFLFDSFFQMHRIFYPNRLHLSTFMVFCVYIVLGLWYLFFFRKQIMETEYLMLALALGFLGLAVIIDTVSIVPRGRTALSDFFKLYGILSWLIYFTRTCWKILTRQPVLEVA